MLLKLGAVLLPLVGTACAHGGRLPATGEQAGAAEPSAVDYLLFRAERAEHLWDRVELYYEREVAPIERVLLRYRDDPVLARRIALALVAEARHVSLEPRLLLAVLLVENPWLDPEARSPVGAVGLMQVMPRHRGAWPPCEPDLEAVESNICHGARIFAHYFRLERGNVEKALLRYNGCVHGTNTPNCHAYPYHVYARAGRASILAWLRPWQGDVEVQ
ncbi:MAG TPA: lytic transglycosylase domain-containing protein [Longimicrobiales bacterium]